MTSLHNKTMTTVQLINVLKKHRSLQVIFKHSNALSKSNPLSVSRAVEALDEYDDDATWTIEQPQPESKKIYIS